VLAITLDLVARKARRIEWVTTAIVDEVIAKIQTILE